MIPVGSHHRPVLLLAPVLFTYEGTCCSEGVMTDNFEIQKLQGAEDYHAWKFSMRMFLLGRDLWEIVEGTETIDEYETDSDIRKFRRRENHALSKICLSIAPSLHIYVRSAKTSKEAWDNLERRFEEKSLTKKIEYRRKLYRIEYEEGTSMIEHVNNLKTLAERLEALGDPVTEKDLVMTLMTSLSETYNNLITTLETVKEDELTWEYVRDRVLSEHGRRCDEKEKKKNDYVHGALYTAGKTESDRLICNYCKEEGHFKRDCQKLLEKKNLGGRREVANISTVEDNFSFHPEFALHVEERADDNWCVDSGCSKNMTYDLCDLANYKKFKFPLDVHLADKTVVQAEGFGKLNFYLSEKNGGDVPITLENVLFVPRLKKKLLSISQITKKGPEMTFSARSCTLNFLGRHFEFGERIGNLYELRIRRRHRDAVSVKIPLDDNLHSVPGGVNQ